MRGKFRFTMTEYERAVELIQTGKMFDCSAAIRRELFEVQRLGEHYPYRREN